MFTINREYIYLRLCKPILFKKIYLLFKYILFSKLWLRSQLQNLLAKM